jgi:radical SAM superfamily enzyme YgiQ (UPF0313 family)
MSNKKILLVRPPMYEVVLDIPAYLGITKEKLIGFYSFASQPTGLIRIGSYLKAEGHDVVFIDCAAEVSSEKNYSVFNQRLIGYKKAGNYQNEKLEFPIYHCGLSYEDFIKELDKYDHFDEIYVTSCMTYHWEPVHRIIEICKEKYPLATVKLGGIYATICPEHAKKSRADEVVVGELSFANDTRIDMSLFNYVPRYIALKSTRGCPNKCSYCAVPTIEGNNMRFRDPKDLVDEIEELNKKHGIKTFLFWESNLLVNSKNHFEKILDLIIERNLGIEISTPEGLQPNLITPVLAKKMKLAGMKAIYLPLETSDDSIAKNRFNRKTTLKSFINAVSYLVDAGFDPYEIRVFVLVGLANQSMDSILDSIILIMELGCKVKPMPFTPIPGTVEYEKYKHLIKDKGLEELHPLLFPFADEKVNVRDLLELCYFNTDLYKPAEFITRLNQNSRIKRLLAKKIRESGKLWDYHYKTNPELAWDNYGIPDFTVVDAVSSGFINFKEDKNVIDIGCGIGKNSLFLLSKGFDISGIDISSFAIDNLMPGLEKGKFVNCDFMKWQTKHKFDVAIDIGCFHCIEQSVIEKYVEKIHSLLNIHGKFILRCFSEYGYEAKRFYQNDTGDKITSPYILYSAYDYLIDLLSKRFEIVASKKLFWCSVKIDGDYRLVPGMYEFYLRKN